MRIVIGSTTNIHVGKSSKSSSDFTPKKKKKGRGGKTSRTGGKVSGTG